LSCSLSRTRDVNQKKALGLPFEISGGHWHNFPVYGSEERMFVIFSASKESLPNIQALSEKKDKIYKKRPDLIVALKISNDAGNILKAIISMKLVRSGKWSEKDIEWVGIRKFFLRSLVESLNKAEKNDNKKWYFRNENILLDDPSILTQYDIVKYIKECMEKIISNGKYIEGKTPSFFCSKSENRYNFLTYRYF